MNLNQGGAVKMERRKSTWHVFWTESLQDRRTNGRLWGMKEGYELRITSRHLA